MGKGVQTMKKPQVIKTQMYRVYFECDLQDIKPGVVFRCWVLADNVQAAIAKIAVAYPESIITSIHSENDRMNSGAPQPEPVVI